MGEQLLHGFPYGRSATWVEPVDLVATSNVDVSTIGFGDTIDGTTVINNARVLLAAQTDPTENGIWVLSTNAAERDIDYKTVHDASRAKAVVVRRGLVNRGSVWVCASYGNLGYVIPGENDSHWVRVDRAGRPIAPDGAIAETMPRESCPANDLTSTLTSGRLSLFGIDLAAGKEISQITFVSGGTALVTGSNQWFCLYDRDLALLEVTDDDTSTAWAANSAKTLGLATAVRPAYDGLHYVGICVVAATPPSLRGLLTGNAALLALTPSLCHTADTGLTNPASAPATATSSGNEIRRPYAYVS